MTFLFLICFFPSCFFEMGPIPSKMLPLVRAFPSLFFRVHDDDVVDLVINVIDSFYVS